MLINLNVYLKLIFGPVIGGCFKHFGNSWVYELIFSITSFMKLKYKVFLMEIWLLN